MSTPTPDLILHSNSEDSINPESLLLGSRTKGMRQLGPKNWKPPAGTVPARGGRAPGPNAATLSAVKIRHEIMRVFAGDLPLAHCSPRVRRYMQVLDKVAKSALKGKTLREFREMNAEVFKLLPREDTLTVRAETIMVGAGADEAADEAIEELNGGE